MANKRRSVNHPRKCLCAHLFPSPLLWYHEQVKYFLILLLSVAAFAQSTPRKSPNSTGRPPAATRPATPAPTVDPDDGSVNENTYVSDYFGFRYTFPEGFGVDEDFLQGKEDQSKRSFLLMAAVDRQEASNQTIVILADNAVAAGATEATTYLDKVAGPLLKRQGSQPEGASRTLSIGGHSFARADFQKQKMAQTVLLTMLRGYAVNFVLTAPSREEVEELVASLQTLQFPSVKTEGTPAP